MKMRNVHFIKVCFILCLCLSLLTGCNHVSSRFGNCVFYIRNGQLHCTDENSKVSWNADNGRIIQVCQDGELLCVVTAMTDRCPSSVYVFSSARNQWDMVDCIHPYNTRILLCHDGFLYYLANETGQIARFRIDEAKNEELPIHHSFMYRNLSVKGDYVYTIDAETDNSRRFLCVYSLSSRTSVTLEIPMETGYRPRLSEGWLYLIPHEIHSGELAILRTDLSQMTPAPSELCWDERIMLNCRAEEYGYWTQGCIQVYGDKLLFETPDRMLMLLQNGEMYPLWELPDAYASADNEPGYYFSSSGLVVVYEKAESSIVMTSDWPGESASARPGRS